MDDRHLAKWLEQFSDESIRKQEPDLSKIIDEVDKLSISPIDETALFKKIETNIDQQQTTKILPLRRIIAVAASVLLLVGAWTFFNQQLTEIVTDRQEFASVELPDKSIIRVNANSSVSYDKSFGQRKVNLNGEAFFDIEKGNEFSVETPTGTITVLGTSFTVFSRDNFLVVTCYSGSVEVKQQQQSTILKPSDRIIVQDETWSTKNLTLDDSMPWSERETIFNEMPLSVVLSSLTHQYGLTLDNQTTKLNDLIFTGSYLNNDIEKALNMVLVPFNINYSLEDANTLILE